MTEHVPEARVQPASTAPMRGYVDVRLTLPPGVWLAVVVSTTVTTHVEVPVGTIVLGEQLMLVEVLSLLAMLTVTLPAGLVLEPWPESPL